MLLGRPGSSLPGTRVETQQHPLRTFALPHSKSRSELPSAEATSEMETDVAWSIADKLGRLVLREASLLWNFKDDVYGMKETMEKLEDRMRYADNRNSGAVEEPAEIVRLQKKFRSVAYDIEDVLDESSAIDKVKYSNPIYKRHTMAHKIKKIKDELDIVEKEAEHLNLVYPSAPTRSEGIVAEANIARTYFMDTEIMVGREKEKVHIMKLLLKSEADEDISIIPIVGLGGIGKTTLAGAVFRDKRTNIFDLKVWVHVSKKFDLLTIGKKIISSRGDENSGTSINDNFPCIKEQIKILPPRRYLIILDDVWEEDKVKLQHLMEMLQYGKKGSKIVMTTRSKKVVDVVDQLRTVFPAKEVKIYHVTLNILSDNNCWKVMWQRELGSDKNLGEGLEEIGKEIAKKCGGLPLLACSLGYLMSRRKTTEAWEDIRDRIISNPKADCVKDILNCLKLSYHCMPFNFKLCFTYCAVFPKGFAINSDILIQQWSALGYIKSVEEGKSCIDDYLLGMSFLQISPSSQVAPMHSRAPYKLIMHDMVHELAKEIADNETVIRDDPGKMIWSKSEKHYCRHMHLVNYDKEQSEVLRKVPGKIRSLHFTGCSRMLLQQNSFSKAKYLRVLDISGCSREGQHTPGSTAMLLPSNMDRLMLLRYLDASGLPISTLPNSLLRLQSMQTLILSNCTLETLPDDIGSLLKLCYLDLSGNRSLKELPKSLGNLSRLSFLNLSGCSKLKEVPETIHLLQCLRHLDMSGCCELQKLPDEICILPKLLVLNLSSCCNLTKLPDKLELKTLEHMNLSSCHELQNLPQNLGKLCNLKFLNLSDCHKVQVLPDSFCNLTNLKELNLSDCHDIRELPECINNLSRLHSLNLTSCYKLQSLPSTFCKMSELKHLNLSYCARLKKLPMSFGELRLQTLDISCCVTLHDLPEGINKMTSLTQLHVTSGHPSMFTKAQTIKKDLNITNRNVHDVSVIDDGKCQELEITDLLNVNHLENIDRTNLHDNPELRVLRLRWDCSILEKQTDAGNLDCSISEKRIDEGSLKCSKPEKKTDLGKQVLENLIPPRSLEDFALFGYPSKDFPTWIHDISSYLPNVHSIYLYKAECHSLPPIGRLPNLRYLVINSVPNITKIGKEFYGKEGTCNKLRFISLESLDNLAEWWTTRSGHKHEDFLIPNLLRLEVKDCAKLKFLPYPPKTMYWYLHSSEEVLPEHGYGLLSSSTLPFSVHIVDCRFSLDKWARLQHLATLEVLGIVGCRDLSTLPEIFQCFGNIRNLYLRSWEKLEILPEWLGQLISLEVLRIKSCPRLKCLPESIRNLTALKKLYISDCPKLIEGEDDHKISHVPEKKFIGVLSQGIPMKPQGSRHSDMQKLLGFSLVGVVSLCLYILARSELISS
ncbi:hypothetical protein SETIT_3G278200v2 [Setaria italica]|uniref:NB-ARC domain-containing protein n=2 Tax=Setaria italica TaxID=4555 RepID=A0A368QLL4_SETIT|nr:putative disease resistance protein RGA3 [Setaria italica]XP_022680646.1 putative disease resistance protein RGA3 [Setaria italica]RCV18159.1 hypothetical protein SETIT_3G278200v2 [Setaria italica]RCV18160.1 hypothetical protein SETIT_3G278200v2 [Setaria italica]